MSAISTLLLVQSDPGLQEALRFGFEREGIEVVSASGSDAIASAVIDTRPELVVTGAESGAEGIANLRAIASALESASHASPVLYVGNGVPREEALASGASEVLDGPAFVRDIVTLGRLLAGRRSADPERAVGSLADHFGLFYVIRAVAAAGKPCVLTLVRGLRRGEIHFGEGGVASAQVGVLHGLPALHQLLLWTDADYEVRAEATGHRRQLILEPGEVVGDAERFLVAVSRVAGSLSPAFIYAANPEVGASALAEMPAPIGSVYRLFDGSRSIADVIEDSPFRVFDTLRIAGRLASLDLIRRAAAGNEERDQLPGRAHRRRKRRRSSSRIPARAGAAIEWTDVLPRRAATDPGFRREAEADEAEAAAVVAEPQPRPTKDVRQRSELARRDDEVPKALPAGVRARRERAATVHPPPLEPEPEPEPDDLDPLADRSGEIAEVSAPPKIAVAGPSSVEIDLGIAEEAEALAKLDAEPELEPELQPEPEPEPTPQPKAKPEPVAPAVVTPIELAAKELDADAAVEDVAFSDEDEAFFRAGRTITKTTSPPVDTFDDLDEEYELPRTFWQRFFRDPGDTRRRGDDDSD